MKKFFALFVLSLFVFMLALSGCEESAPESKDSSRPSAVPEAPPSAAQSAPSAVPEEPESEPSNYQEVMAEAERQMGEAAEEADVAPSGSGGSCAVLQQCSSGDDLCWMGKCWTEAELWADFSKCKMMKCDAPCAGCESGHEKCTVATSAGSKMYNVCVDCVQGVGCKEGFTCDMGRCV
ncbi:MAG: hypothetical protein KKD17_05630 [Nanoarchaeota archaeon]|nr:hypothetical protein [Nanoarchaeota archaeon]